MIQVFINTEEVKKTYWWSWSIWKKFFRFGAQVYLLDRAHEMLVKRIDELENLNRSENEVLRKLLDNQQDRVKLVMEIAKKERGDVYNDITSLIENQERFGLDSLLEYY